MGLLLTGERGAITKWYSDKTSELPFATSERRAERVSVRRSYHASSHDVVCGVYVAVMRWGGKILLPVFCWPPGRLTKSWIQINMIRYKIPTRLKAGQSRYHVHDYRNRYLASTTSHHESPILNIPHDKLQGPYHAPKDTLTFLPWPQGKLESLTPTMTPRIS